MTCSGCTYNCTETEFRPPEPFALAGRRKLPMNLPIRRVSGYITPYRDLKRDQFPVLQGRLLPQSLRGSLTPLGRALPDPSNEHDPSPLYENSSETPNSFTIDLLSFRSTFTYRLPHLWERQLAAYRRAEQLESTDKDRTPPIVDIYV